MRETSAKRLQEGRKRAQAKQPKKKEKGSGGTHFRKAMKMLGGTFPAGVRRSGFYS